MFREQYAFTELKGIDWDAMAAKFRPLFEEAEKNNDVEAYRRALRDFMLSIPDAHITAPIIREDFQKQTSGGLGMAIRELDDGRTIVNFITPDGPADKAGLKVGAQIIEMDGMPVNDFVDGVQPYSGPFGTEHFKRLQQLRYATRAPLGTEVEVTYKNPDSEEATTTLTAETEDASFRFSSFNRGLTGAELPVEFKILDNGLGYAKVNSFFDNELLTVQLWEQMMKSLNSLGVPGLILDLRQNGGGSGFLADQMAAYFFNDELVLRNTEFYDKELGKFFADPDLVQTFIPPDPELQYKGKVAVIVGPNCASACEFFAYDMTKQGRAEIVGQYPTAGAGGSRHIFMMPGPEALLIPVGRPLDADGNIIVEGRACAPTVRVPVSEETLFYDGDPLLDIAVAVIKDEPLPHGATKSARPAVQLRRATPPRRRHASETPVATEEVTPTESVIATEVPTEVATATEAMVATEAVTPTETSTATEAVTAAATEAATETATETPTEAATTTATETPAATEAATRQPRNGHALQSRKRHGNACGHRRSHDNRGDTIAVPPAVTETPAATEPITVTAEVTPRKLPAPPKPSNHRGAGRAGAVYTLNRATRR